MDLAQYPECWVVDTEYRPPRYPREGDPVQPIAWCGRELHTGREVQIWLGDGDRPEAPPHGPGALVIAFAAAAEAGCYASLGWSRPAQVLDLMPEANLQTNGPRAPRLGLLACLGIRGLAGMAAATKGDMRDRILRGPPFLPSERDEILHYCLQDVRLTARLLEAVPVDLPRALIRGRYAWHCGEIAHRGIPIDTDAHEQIRRHWPTIRAKLIEKVNPSYGCPYDANGAFRSRKFAAWLETEGIPWPRLKNGSPVLTEEVFTDLAKARPELRELADLRNVLGQMRAFTLPLGVDGRARADLLPMFTKTGRNAPGGGFIFIASAWLRSLIRPEPGRALAYIDYSSEEILIAAALAQDAALAAAYHSGDPYTAFGRAAGLIPPGGDKSTHPDERAACKQAMLSVAYGTGARALAAKIGTTETGAADLLRRHREAFPAFWAWRTRTILRMQTHGALQTAYGWRQANHPGMDERAAGNFPIQAAGGDILRAAVILLEEAGIRTLATIHDAVLIEAGADEVNEVVTRAQELMADAAEIVLGDGYRLRTDAEIIPAGDRYRDKRGRVTWERVMAILEEAGPAPRETVQEVLAAC